MHRGPGQCAGASGSSFPGEHSTIRHHSQGAPANSGGGSSLGPGVAEPDSLSQVRQYGSCGHSQFGLVQGKGGHAPQEVPGILGGERVIPYMGVAY